MKYLPSPYLTDNIFNSLISRKDWKILPRHKILVKKVIFKIHPDSREDSKKQTTKPQNDNMQRCACYSVSTVLYIYHCLIEVSCLYFKAIFVTVFFSLLSYKGQLQ